MHKNFYAMLPAALRPVLLHLVQRAGALVGIGSVHIEEHSVTAVGLDLVHNSVDALLCRTAVKVNSKNVQT